MSTTNMAATDDTKLDVSIYVGNVMLKMSFYYSLGALIFYDGSLYN